MGFEQFAGNQRIKDTLQQMIAAGRLPHAILLAGEEGLGKLTLAKIIAKAAVCDGQNAPCENCPQCHLAGIDNHPDITFYEPEKDRKMYRVDDIREYIKDSYVKPSQAKRRVIIFKEGHRISEAGQNVLLKTLEEPPKNVIFIILTESSSAMLSTVLSRCTTFSLSAPSLEEGVQALTAMGIAADEAEVRLLSAACNIGRAINLGKGRKPKADPADFIDLIAAGDSYAALLLLKKMEKDRNAALVFFNQLHLALISARRAEALGKGYTGLSADYLKFMDDAVLAAADQCDKNGNLSLIFHTLCLRLK